MPEKTILEVLEQVLIDDGKRQFDQSSALSPPADSFDVTLRRHELEIAAARRQKEDLEEVILFLRIENDALNRELRILRDASHPIQQTEESRIASRQLDLQRAIGTLRYRAIGASAISAALGVVAAGLIVRFHPFLFWLIGGLVGLGLIVFLEARRPTIPELIARNDE